MKILRHILSHLFLISFLIAVVSVYYYRTLLLPSDVVGDIDGVVNKVYPPALKFVSKRDYFWSIRRERIVSFDDLNLFSKKDKVADEVKPIAMTETGKIDVVQSENQKELEITIAKKNEIVIVKKSVIEPKKENNASKNNKVEELPVIVKDRDTRSERDLLISARNAFNQGAMIESEKFYLELTQLDQDSPNAFGELGNVYYSQGKWDRAGQAYYEAAVRLISAGNHNQVVYLQRVINGLNTEYAEKLAQLMMRQ